MYADAARLKVYEKSGTFPKVTKAIGLESLRSILEEETEFPATKGELSMCMRACCLGSCLTGYLGAWRKL